MGSKNTLVFLEVTKFEFMMCYYRLEITKFELMMCYYSYHLSVHTQRKCKQNGRLTTLHPRRFTLLVTHGGNTFIRVFLKNGF